MSIQRIRNISLSLLTLVVVLAVAYRKEPPLELPNRIPEAAPYDLAEAKHFAPPYEEHWQGAANPARCGTCHPQVLEEWNGSMMSNSWRDPAWRAAFLLIARQTATDGDCDVPQPPDGTQRATHNPFAISGCRSRFDTGEGHVTMARQGSLVDGFCSRCHMPTNYMDNIPLQNVSHDPQTGREHGRIRETFDPTSDGGTGIAFAEVEEHLRNTDSGRRGLTCGVCHTMASSRETPFHNYPVRGQEHVAAVGDGGRLGLLPPESRESIQEPAPEAPNLGYGVGAGAFRFSPNAIASGEVFGPLAAAPETAGENAYLSEVFGQELAVEQGEFGLHQGFRHTKFERAEMCASCHDVTNPLTVRNPLGKWVGGFPIERTYTEWLESRYADRPGNQQFDAGMKRDCQTCHMQQTFGQPGTAQTLYRDGRPEAPLVGPVSDGGPSRTPYFSHHFIGGNAYVPNLIGTDIEESGAVSPWPELSVYSFSSADPSSPYYNAYWTNTENRGQITRHGRLAWDRLRYALDLETSVPASTRPGSQVPLEITVRNSGCGHNFPSGFPEGRVAWVALRAYDLGSGAELEIEDRHWQRRSRGVGYLTTEDMEDPSFPGCDWKLPAGSPDPYAYQMKAVASKGDGCPTLDLLYAAPLNLVTNEKGLPVDAEGRVIGRENPEGLPQFRDLDGDGDLFDDSFLTDTRLRPLPHDDATLHLDRYSVVVPRDVTGPVAVVSGVYYQSLEAIVAKKFLGNLADLDGDQLLEPCVLGGACDGRVSQQEPAVVEGAPPVPLEIVTQVIQIDGRPDRQPPRLEVYPPNGARAPRDVVAKVTFSEPVTGIDATTFQLEGPDGQPIAASVDQIGDGTWGLFPHEVFLEPGVTYTARLTGKVCDAAGLCLESLPKWSFRIAQEGKAETLATVPPLGFDPGERAPRRAPRLEDLERRESEVLLAFSEPVLNVTPRTVRLLEAPSGVCPETMEAPLAARLESDPEGRTFTLRPETALVADRTYCVAFVGEIYDLEGDALPTPYRALLTRPSSGRVERPEIDLAHAGAP